MNRKKISAALAAAMLLTLLGGCGRSAAPGQSTPVSDPAPAVTAESAAQSDPGNETLTVTEAEPGRQDGERFETVIILEGMEETVRYEHVRNDALGFEMDYDYESFTRRSEAGRECFVSVWDRPENPENYLEVTARAESADAAAASVRAALSQEYELLEGTRELAGTGSCIRIEAAVIKGTDRMADQIRVAYIIPASDGCRVAEAHYAVEAAEGFGRRFHYMLDTLTLLDRDGEAALSGEQALVAVRNCCFLSDPGLKGIAAAGEYPVYWELASDADAEITVLFRSYTGALIRYHIDPASGETYVTESVPGITPDEQRTDESLNMRDYLLSVPGTWQTASMRTMDGGTMAPEYHVRFTDTEILYGYLKDSSFVFDHADGIFRLEENAAGGFTLQAEASNGVRYTYRSSESDSSVLEYYETWDENAFPEAYRGGASLSRCL